MLSEVRTYYLEVCIRLDMNLSAVHKCFLGEYIRLDKSHLEAHKLHPEGCSLLGMKSEVHTRHSEESCQTDTALAVRRYYPVGCNQLGTDRWVVHRHRPEV